MSQARQLRLGTILHGASGNMSAWRHPAAKADASINFAFVQETALRKVRFNRWGSVESLAVLALP